MPTFKMIPSSGLLADVKQRALAMFDKLAAVEAALHGDDPEVMFHEVGALDSIVDIVGVAAALSWLSPKRVVSRTVPLGSGRGQDRPWAVTDSGPSDGSTASWCPGRSR